jgi:hypothetical protein
MPYKKKTPQMQAKFICDCALFLQLAARCLKLAARCVRLKLGFVTFFCILHLDFSFCMCVFQGQGYNTQYQHHGL